MGKVAEVTRENFETEVLGSDVPIMVDFWAPWCPPCRAVAPELDTASEALTGRAKIVKLNVDDEPEIESRYGVRTIPTLIIFKGGVAVDTIHGAVRSRVIVERIEAQITA
ncbi:MAG: trxA2 [Capsulimonas sp.]|jgi:thioredoxin 1|nr:trxA2 [Capsulimonas sp.]